MAAQRAVATDDHLELVSLVVVGEDGGIGFLLDQKGLR